MAPLRRAAPGPAAARQYQPRTRMDEGSLYELAESIRSQGIMQPILVRPVGLAGWRARYEIIAGERRFRAAKLARLDGRCRCSSSRCPTKPRRRWR